MFVFQSTYDKLKRRFDELDDALELLDFRHNKLVNDWNELVGRVNKLGGEQFLRTGEALVKTSRRSELSRDDIKRLLQLCHPDKHAGSQLSVDMTTMLNGLLGKRK